ncbi:MAG: hypothetical protein K9M51_01260 [Candidatus Gracilibacteria bacterium]|nr:hypothetical protein [Candidatus Gracilibacteria bacterium]
MGIDISSPSSEKMFITVFLIFGGLFYFLACAAGKEYKQLGVKIWGVATTIGLEAMLFLEKYEVAIPEVLRLNLVTEVIVWIFLGIISVILWNLGNSKK